MTHKTGGRGEGAYEGWRQEGRHLRPFQHGIHNLHHTHTDRNWPWITGAGKQLSGALTTTVGAGTGSSSTALSFPGRTRFLDADALGLPLLRRASAAAHSHCRPGTGHASQNRPPASCTRARHTSRCALEMDIPLGTTRTPTPARAPRAVSITNGQPSCPESYGVKSCPPRLCSRALQSAERSVA